MTSCSATLIFFILRRGKAGKLLKKPAEIINIVKTDGLCGFSDIALSAEQEIFSFVDFALVLILKGRHAYTLSEQEAEIRGTQSH